MTASKVDIESAAEHIYAAMVWAKNTGGIANPWVAGGNSDAQMQARRTAGMIVSMMTTPVPTPEPEYNTYKGVTYQKDEWRVEARRYSGEYGVSHLICDMDGFTDGDHAALLALKANPVKVATPTVEPHKKTPRQLVRSALLDAVVASDAHGSAAGYSEALGRIGDALLSALDDTPATMASEPVVITRLRDWATRTQSFTLRDNDGMMVVGVDALLAAYDARHPATEAEALAVLVGAGYRNLIADDSSLRFAGARRILVAPEGTA